jgi:hypothetical protein
MRCGNRNAQLLLLLLLLLQGSWIQSERLDVADLSVAVRERIGMSAPIGPAVTMSLRGLSSYTL